MTEETYTKAVYRNNKRLYLLALSFVGQQQDAEDILQNVFLKLWRSGISYQDDTHLDKWLTRVTVNESKSLLRRASRKNVPLDEAEQPLVPEQTEGAEVVAAVMRLPPEQRSVIHLYYFEELSVKDIAGLLHLGQSTVKTRLYRGRCLLRKYLKEEMNK